MFIGVDFTRPCVCPSCDGDMVVVIVVDTPKDSIRISHNSKVAVVTFDDGFVGSMQTVLLGFWFCLDDGKI